jgi:hypothetical protein
MQRKLRTSSSLLIPTILLGSRIPTVLLGSRIPTVLLGLRIPTILLGLRIPTVLLDSRIPTVLLGSRIPTVVSTPTVVLGFSNSILTNSNLSNDVFGLTDLSLTVNVLCSTDSSLTTVFD